MAGVDTLSADTPCSTPSPARLPAMTSSLAARPIAPARPILLSALIALALSQGACSVSTEAPLDAPRDVPGRESVEPVDASTTATRENEAEAEPDNGQASPTTDEPAGEPDSGSGPGTGSGSGSVSEAEPTAGTNAAPIGCGATLGRALELINAARAEARSCGSVRYEAAAPLVWDSRLQDAALVHSTDMTTNDFFSHTGSDGSAIEVRVERTGYDWQTVGENIAAGQPTIDVATSGWVDSPLHCANLMNPRFEDVAVACVADDSADFGVYWTQVFGRTFPSSR